MPTHLRTLLLAALLALGGCAGVPGTPPAETPREGADEALARARALQQDGDFRAAADAYLQAAAARSGSAAQRLRLEAAEALLQAADPEAAGRLLEATPIEPRDAALELRRALLRAEVLLATRGAAPALASLPATVADDLPLELRRQLHAQRARLLARAGDPLGSASERLLLATLLDDPAAIGANQQALLATLALLAPAYPDPATLEPELAGWVALARLAGAPPRAAGALDAEIAAWRAQYPDHPVLPALLQALRERRASAAAPARLALLLPADGPFAAAAATLRSGFVAAFLADTAAAETTLRFYDSGGNDSAPALAAYRQAVDDGAALVIGPLRKEAVTALAALPQRPVPVLALNTLSLEVHPGPGFYQFGLSPEGEARAAAERAWQDGRRNALLLVPATDYGQRVAAAFSDHWRQLGGQVLEERGYDPAQNDFTDPITGALLLTASELRQRELRGLLQRKLEFEPRRRQDVDAVFLVAQPRQARLILPQLDFHRAADLPVYTTSQTYAPGTAAEENRDLEGIRFCDMPWTLAPAEPELGAGLPAAAGALARLFALGVDAYRLLPYLERLAAAPDARVDGLTGILGVDARGQVTRRLVCAEILAGTPRMLGYTPPTVLDMELVPPAERTP